MTTEKTTTVASMQPFVIQGIPAVSVDSRPLQKHELFMELARYPDPPEPFGNLFEIDIPGISAIYFLHNQGRIEYVGKANDLQKRIGGMNALRHKAVEDHDQISWIRFDDEVLEFVECYYIWLCRPGRNFGRKDECFFRRMELRKQNG
jgi:hypothetical protein